MKLHVCVISVSHSPSVYMNAGTCIFIPVGDTKKTVNKPERNAPPLECKDSVCVPAQLTLLPNLHYTTKAQTISTMHCFFEPHKNHQLATSHTKKWHKSLRNLFHNTYVSIHWQFCHRLLINRWVMLWLLWQDIAEMFIMSWHNGW